MFIKVEQNFPTLYKYIKSKHVDSTLRDGVFRIGTLYEYRKYDHLELGDEEEGMKTWWMPNDEAGILAFTRRYPHLSGILRDPGLPEALADDVLLAVQERSPDCYMFCVTHEFDPEVMQSFDCDACIEITDPLLFFLALTAQMHKQVEAAMLRVCHYLDRYGLHDGHNEFAPQTLKPPRFAHQNEVRLVWDPIYPKGEGPGFELAPIFLKCTEAARYCRRLI